MKRRNRVSSQRETQSRNNERVADHSGERSSKRLAWAGIALFFVAGVLLGAILSHGAMRSPASASSTNSTRTPTAERAMTLGDLLVMTPEELEKVDIAEANLLCAQGLPGAEKIDIPKTLATLDEWTEKVRFETERHLYRVTDPRHAEHYKNSEAVFRMEMLAQVLQEDCGVRYNPERIRDVDFTNASDLFIHGLIDGERGGTCMSMPVLYTAVARRLGYPVRLTEAKGHLLCRWEGGGERWNIEGAGEGFSTFDDAHYRRWPHPISDEEIQRGEYLKSLDSAEELGVFFAARAYCLEDNGRLPAARLAYARAHELHPDSRATYSFFKDAVLRQSPGAVASAASSSQPENAYRDHRRKSPHADGENPAGQPATDSTPHATAPRPSEASAAPSE